jgi:hypothetical protein
MTKFSIRDMLFLMVIVGLAIGWWVYARQREREAAELRAEVRAKENVAVALETVLRAERQMLLMQQRANEAERKLVPLPNQDLPQRRPTMPDSILEKYRR